MRARAAPIYQRGLRRQHGFRYQYIDGEIRELQGALIEWV
jgi:hypothetical protein